MIKKIHFLPLLILPLLCIIFGSFFDKQIASSIAIIGNPFSLSMESIGALGSFGVWAFCGAGLIFYGICFENKKPMIYLEIILGVLSIIASLYLEAQVLIVAKLFQMNIYKWVAYLVSSILILGFASIGYFFSKKYPSTNLVKVFILVIVITSLGPALCTVLKRIEYRPRYYWLVSSSGSLSDYKNWWESGKKVMEAATKLGSDVECFYSWPSGHAASAPGIIVFLAYLPYVYKKSERLQTILIYVGLVFSLIIMFSRMLAGAHFLSDIGFGMFFSMCFFLIGDIIFFNKKKPMINMLSKEG